MELFPNHPYMVIILSPPQPGYDVANMVIGEIAGGIEEPSMYVHHSDLAVAAKYYFTGCSQSIVGEVTAGNNGDLCIRTSEDLVAVPTIFIKIR